MIRDVPNADLDIRGLPNNPEFMPRIRIDNREMERFDREIVGHTMLAIVDNANKNNMRKAAWYVLSNDRFENRDFDDLVNNVANFAFMLITMERFRVDDALSEAANKLLSGFCVSLADRDRALRDDWTDRTERHASDIRREMDDIRYAVDRFYNGGGGRGGRYHDDRGRGGYNDRTYTSRDPRDDRGRGRDDRRDRDGGFSMLSGRGSSRRPTGGPLVDDRNAGMEGEGRILNVVGSFGNRQKQQEREPEQQGTGYQLRTNDHRAYDSMRVGAVVTTDKRIVEEDIPEVQPRKPEPTPQVPVREELRAPSKPNRRIIPIYKSKTKPKHNPENPYSYLYNPLTHIAVYAEDEQTGDVTEIIIEMDDAVDYNLHNTERFFIKGSKILKDPAPNLAAGEEEIRRIIANRELNSLLERIDQQEGAVLDISSLQNMVVIPEPIDIYQGIMPQDALGLILGTITLQAVATVGECTVNFCYNEMFHAAFVGAEADQLAILANCKNTYDLRAAMVGAVDVFTRLQWEEVHKRITEHANEILNVHLQTGIKMTSFVDDYDELMVVLKEEFGETIRDAYMRGGLNIANSIRYTDETAEGGEKTYRLNRANNVTFVRIPCIDFNIGCANRVGRVSKESTPETYEAIRAIWANSQKDTRYVRMIFSDGYEIRIHKSILLDDVYLVSAV